MLAAVGGAVLAVIAVIALLIRRKRVNKTDEDDWLEPAEADETGNLDEDATVQMDAMDAAVKLDSDEMPAEEQAFDEDLEDTVMGLENDSETAAEAEAEHDDVFA